MVSGTTKTMTIIAITCNGFWQGNCPKFHENARGGGLPHFSPPLVPLAPLNQSDSPPQPLQRLEEDGGVSPLLISTYKHIYLHINIIIYI